MTHPITVAVLRHLQVHGASTKAEIVAALGELPHSTINNLKFLGHAAVDHTTNAARYSITPRGRAKLQGLSLRRLRTDEVKLEAARRANSYLGEDVRTPSNRPGAMDAYALPSRIGSRLRWPDGRTTPIDHPTTGENSHG